MKRKVLLLAAALTLPLPALPATTASPVKSLHQLFDAEWERGLRESPESASFYGDTRYNDRWADLSLAAIEASHHADEAALAKLAKIRRAALPAQEQVNYDLFEKQYRLAVEGYRFRAFLMPVSPVNWSGFGGASQLTQAIRFAHAKDYEDWLARLEHYGAYVDQHIALMRLGMKEGRVPPKITMQRISKQIATQLVSKPEDSALYAPFRTFPDTIVGSPGTELEFAL